MKQVPTMKPLGLWKRRFAVAVALSKPAGLFSNSSYECYHYGTVCSLKMVSLHYLSLSETCFKKSNETSIIYYISFDAYWATKDGAYITHTHTHTHTRTHTHTHTHTLTH